MFSSIKKISSKYTGLLIRMDDISEHMNWELMDKCETLFDKYQIKPLLGVIPINQDPELLKYSRNDKFWERVTEIEFQLGEDGRVLIRPSGTEPLIRIMVESVDSRTSENLCNSLADLAQTI